MASSFILHPSAFIFHPSSLRAAAGRVARQCEDAAAPYTTLDAEAAVVRLLGVTGADAVGQPLARRFVAHLRDRGLLGQGGAHGLAGAMTRLRADADASVERALADDLPPVDLAIPVEVTPKVLRPIVRGVRRTLEARRRERDDRLATLPAGPGYRLAEFPLGDDAALRQAARDDLAVVVCSPGGYPAEETLRQARLTMNQVSERAGRTIRLGLRGPAEHAAYLSALAALHGLDALVLTDSYGVTAHLARRICALAGMLALGVGSAADSPGADLARALVAGQLAALAGLPPTGWGWIPGQPAHHDALADFLAPAFVAQTGDVSQDDTCSVSHADALAYLEAWPPPTLDPAILIKKAPGYWNPFA